MGRAAADSRSVVVLLEARRELLRVRWEEGPGAARKERRGG